MATAHVDKDSESWILGLSKEVYDISEFLVLFEKIAQKCRNSNKKIATVRVLFGGSVFRGERGIKRSRKTQGIQIWWRFALNIPLKLKNLQKCLKRAKTSMFF